MRLVIFCISYLPMSLALWDFGANSKREICYYGVRVSARKNLEKIRGRREFSWFCVGELAGLEAVAELLTR